MELSGRVASRPSLPHEGCDIELSVYTDNAPAIHLYEKFGFVVEGTARQYALRGGVYVDAHLMARLRDLRG